MDEGRMKRFIPGRWKGESGGVDKKRLFRAAYLAGNVGTRER